MYTPGTNREVENGPSSTNRINRGLSTSRAVPGNLLGVRCQFCTCCEASNTSGARGRSGQESRWKRFDLDFPSTTDGVRIPRWCSHGRHSEPGLVVSPDCVSGSGLLTPAGFSAELQHGLVFVVLWANLPRQDQQLFIARCMLSYPKGRWPATNGKLEQNKACS